jgi:predicted lipoprotein with Yx(FWY)xxD motif
MREEKHRMFFFKRSLLLVGLLLMVFVAACGSASTTTTGGTNYTMSGTNNKTGSTMTDGTATGAMGKSTPTSSTKSNYPTQQPTQSANMGGNMQGNTAFIHITKVALNGKAVMVLANAKGMILYYKLNDPRPASACTGACAQSWPPVLANGMTMITSSMALPHKLAVYMTANGNQVEYDGHPLYTYTGDMTPGQFSGRGMGNVWYLVSTAL